MKYRLGLVAVVFAMLSACVAVPDGNTNGGVITVPAPIIIGQHPDIIILDKQGKDKDKNNAIYLCKLKAFTSTYQAEDTNRGKAMLSVKKQCLANNHEMFCQDQDITCKEYK